MILDVDPDDLRRSLEVLVHEVRAADLDLPVPGVDEARAHRDRLVADLEAHVARLADLQAPLLVVVGGVTGAGKSTLVNSLARAPVARTGALRPTTSVRRSSAPPADHARGDDPRLDEVEHTTATAPALPEGVALLDAPDVDSVAAANRELAGRLLDAADLWLYCTESRKYADTDSMRELRRARDRRARLAVVLGQLPTADADELLAHFRELLAAEGLGDVRVFGIDRVEVEGGRLPETAVAEIRSWLDEYADLEMRRETVLATLRGAVATVPDDVDRLLVALEARGAALHGLAADVDDAWDEAQLTVAETASRGVAVRDEVLDRWERFLGTGRVVRMVRQSTAGARRVLQSAFARIPGFEDLQAPEAVREEAADATGRALTDAASLAVLRVRSAWAGDPVGAQLVEAVPEGPRADLAARATAAVAEWQEEVAELVATRGLARRDRGRIAALGLNAVTTGLVVTVLVSTGGVITGAETGVATAASAANQMLLTSLLGSQTLAWLTGRSRELLLERLTALLDEERTTVRRRARRPGRGPGAARAPRARGRRGDGRMVSLRSGHLSRSLGHLGRLGRP